MIATMFLPRSDYDLYKLWLVQQDPDTLRTYFGVNVTTGFIDHLMTQILNDPLKHHFLVAFDHDKWVGVVHIANTPNNGAEFGFIVDPEYRQQGIGDRLMDEATTWCRNRGYKRLYLHCLARNEPIKKLCLRHGLTVHNQDGDADAEIDLPPPSFFTLGKEISLTQRNLFTLMLNRTLHS